MSQNSELLELRPVERNDLPWMADMAADPNLVGAHNWDGVERTVAEVLSNVTERFETDGFLGARASTLIVALGQTPIGDVSWRIEQWGPTERSRCPAIGVALLPEFRGRGYGTTAQRLLVDRLFDADPNLHRVQSDTAVDNPAEQRALEKVGLISEGVVRDAEFRNGAFYDHVLYGILRSEWESARR